MRKPKNRKERIAFLIQKLGLEFVRDLYGFTDGEIKKFVDKSYNSLANRKDYASNKNEQSTCIRCNSIVETEFHTYCHCGTDRAVYDEKMWKDDIEDNDDRVDGDEEFLKKLRTLNTEEIQECTKT